MEVVHHYPNVLGFYDTSSLGNGGIWIDPDRGGSIFLWRLAWPRDIVEDIVEDLVSWSNPWGKIKNYYLELVVLVLQGSCFHDV